MARKKKNKAVLPEGVSLICSNKKAFRNYDLGDRFEAGVELRGTEVKSLRDGKAHLNDSYVTIDRGEAYLVNMHIAPWETASYDNHKPLRRRKLLLHKQEIKKLRIKIEQRGFSLVPTKAYFKKGRAKVEISLGKGRSLTDKRELIKERDEKRIAQRTEKQRDY
jgi:SsrA-binding protein